MQTNGTSTAAASIQAAAVAATSVAIQEATSEAHDIAFTSATEKMAGGWKIDEQTGEEIM